MEHGNRLINEKSPYLLQHAHNPVDWYPWGREAFERAERENRPIFLSVGYATCHWCHVMERESFEDEEVARLLNEHFVSIKVDREERPDIDQIYMSAVQALTGSGGWPMSVFLMADGRPFYGGTYFPHRRFTDLLRKVATTYRRRRVEVELAAAEVAEAVSRMSAAPGQREPRLDRSLVDGALGGLEQQFDEAHGGFGGAPKFPPHNALPLLFREYRERKDERLLEMATRTLDGMALGGIRDHVGGGFHRYATDGRWFAPHFEKMLYDNALLGRAYAEAHLLTGDAFYREVAEEIYAWVAREMTHREGGFYAALDADSEGVEGKFYLWRKEDVLDVLGREEGEVFCRTYNVEPGGNYREEATGQETGANILYLRERLAELGERMGRARRQLLDARAGRVRPRLDDKILTSWNGLMIGSLAYAGRHLREPRYTAAAERGATFVLSHLGHEGRLLRRWREGEAKHPACLDDYVFLAQGLLELHEATGESAWLRQAGELMEAAVSDFQDPEQGGFFFTADGADLFTRPRQPLDHALPSGNGIAAQVLIRLGQLTGRQGHFGLAERTLRASASWMARAPRATESLILAASMYLDAHGEQEATTARRAAPAAQAGKHPVHLEAFPSAARVGAGQTLSITLEIEIAQGWHISAARPLEKSFKPTSVEVSASFPAEVGAVHYPEGKRVTLGPRGDPLSLYTGSVAVEVPLTVSSDAKPGPGSVSVSLSYQACDERRCLAPDRLDLRVPVEIAA